MPPAFPRASPSRRYTAAAAAMTDPLADPVDTPPRSNCPRVTHGPDTAVRIQADSMQEGGSLLQMGTHRSPLMPPTQDLPTAGGGGGMLERTDKSTVVWGLGPMGNRDRRGPTQHPFSPPHSAKNHGGTQPGLIEKGTLSRDLRHPPLVRRTT